MPINNHTKELFLYIAFAPEEIKKKYNNGYNRWFTYKQKDKTIKEENKEWYFMRNNLGDSSFAGLLFRENKVYVHNIYLYDVKNDYKEQYLEITGIFNELLKKYNIYHACILALAVLKNSCKESYLTENIILYVKTDREYHLPKFRYQLARHQKKKKKFLVGRKGIIGKRWYKIFYKTIAKIQNLSTFADFRKTRPQLFLCDMYSTEPEFRKVENKPKPSDGVQKRTRKPRRHFLGTHPYRE